MKFNKGGDEKGRGEYGFVDVKFGGIHKYRFPFSQQETTKSTLIKSPVVAFWVLLKDGEG